MKRFISTWNRTSLIKRIAIGVVIGAVLGLLVPKFTVIGLLGDMFVGGLKAIAPLLVFALVANALSQTREGHFFFFCLSQIPVPAPALLSRIPADTQTEVPDMPPA